MIPLFLSRSLIKVNWTDDLESAHLWMNIWINLVDFWGEQTDDWMSNDIYLFFFSSYWLKFYSIDSSYWKIREMFEFCYLKLLILFSRIKNIENEELTCSVLLYHSRVLFDSLAPEYLFITFDIDWYLKFGITLLEWIYWMRIST